MKHSRVLAVLALLGFLQFGLSALARASPVPMLPPPPPPLPPPGFAPPNAGPLGAVPPRGYWRYLSPAEREAIRRLSQEQRQALVNPLAPRAPPLLPGVPPPGGRLSPEERRQLRDQIREEHERRGGRFGSGKRP